MELLRALAVLAEPSGGEGAARLAVALGLGPPPGESEHAELFDFQLYPYASVYLGAEGMLGGEARSRVAGFLSALGIEPAPEPDHLSTMLALHARLAEADSSAGGRWRAARRAHLWEHLLSWLPLYLDKLAEIAPPFYKGWAELLSEALAEEARIVGRQESLPLHLREAPRAADPRAVGAEEFLRSLLAPARSGMIIVRSDLARAARSLGLGVRAGERAFALKSLLGQDAGGALGWLASEARGWAGRHARRRELLGGVAEWWSERAAATASLLEELRDEGRAV